MSAVSVTILAFTTFALGLAAGYCFAYNTLKHKVKGSIQYAIDEDENYLFLALYEPASTFIQHKFVVMEIEAMNA